MIELVFCTKAGPDKSDGSDHKPSLRSVQQSQHLFYHLILEDEVLDAEAMVMRAEAENLKDEVDGSWTGAFSGCF